MKKLPAFKFGVQLASSLWSLVDFSSTPFVPRHFINVLLGVQGAKPQENITIFDHFWPVKAILLEITGRDLRQASSRK
jgi:hypothetical protein